VELLVAIGLFGVIVSIAMGGFVRALRAQKQIVALITASSNASLVIEQMSREMRTGFNFCATPCSSPSDAVNFTNARGEEVVYSLGMAPEGYGIITRQVSGGPVNQITADSVNIRYLKFYFLENANYPPRVTLLIGLSPRAGRAANVSENITNIQTTVSARSFAP
jgi:type II secretory pathway pseudopilin PulG